MATTILIIDDDHDFSDAVTTMLQSQGYAVLTADNGKEGFKQAKEKKPDLILLDVMMTQKTEGFDAARDLKHDAATKDIPVVLVTGIRKAMNLAFGFEPDEDWLPVKTVLEKPVKPEVLLQAIRQELK
ncbi:MAG: response regulator [Candidatus Omnitrophica bacterium]|nr:response regulator [Candidatus Omnitrophota bacterium]